MKIRLVTTLSCLLLLSNVICNTQEIVKLPELTGAYAVGIVEKYLVDESREEKYTTDPNDKREIKVQIWYPAVTTANVNTGRYWPSPDLEAYMEVYKEGLKKIYPNCPPDSFWDQYDKVYANAIPDASFLNSILHFPVLIYSPGWVGTPRLCNTYLLEELASHGYLVIGIEHPYDAAAVTFPDGRVVITNQDFNPTLRSQDILFVLNELEKTNNTILDNRFEGKINLSKIGVLGLSLGGKAAAITLKTDRRFKAGLTLDSSELYGFDQPIMHILRQERNISDRMADKVSKCGGYQCTINDTMHWDFSEEPLIWKLLGMYGRFPIESHTDDPIRIHRIIADYAIAFFDLMLKTRTTNCLMDLHITIRKLILKFLVIPNHLVQF